MSAGLIRQNFQKRVEAFAAMLRSSLAELELMMPEPELAGAYEPGGEYQFYRDLKTIVGFATTDLFIIDNYLDTQLFDVYMENVKSPVASRVLTNQVNDPLRTVAEKFGKRGNFELRSSKDVHDRVVFADDRGLLCPRPFSLAFCVAALCILVLLGNGQSNAQQVPRYPVSGTLNVVLANRRGFVIAADSRGSSSQEFFCEQAGRRQRYCDNSQKLFQTSSQSAMVIAGYASALGGGPYEFEIAAAIRGEFGHPGYPASKCFIELNSSSGASHACRIQPDRTGTSVVDDWLDDLQPFLTKVLLLSVAIHPDNTLQPLIATVAGFDKNGVPEIRQTTVSPKEVPCPAGGGGLAVYGPSEHQGPMTADTFVYKTAGISQVADRILAGEYLGRNDDLQWYAKYKRTGNQRKLDKMSLAQMERIARALFEETENTPIVIQGQDVSKFVGGRTQIATFRSPGKLVSWDQQEFPAKIALLLRASLTIGGAYSDKLEEREQPEMMFIIDDFAEPISVPFHSIFACNKFQSMRISLDGNVFIRTHFVNPTFLYRQQGEGFFVSGTIDGTCTMEVPVVLVMNPSSLRWFTEKGCVLTPMGN